MATEGDSSSALVELRGATFGYGKRAVVHVDELQLHRARCLGIFGPNGSGKTTLVRGLAGLIAPLAGQVIRSPELLMSYLPQHRALDLQWPMTGMDAASLAISARNLAGWVGRDREAIRISMRALGVEDLSNRSFSKLSGGQQQRLLLAGALACAPQILILDEPTNGLDMSSRQKLLQHLQSAMTTGLSIVIISHDIEDLLQLCQQVAWLHPGDDPEKPSRVEVLAASDLEHRLLHAPRVIS